MDLGALRIFAAVAEEGSISKAARRLDYVQSNVTARIQHLEDDLQTPLFYRRQRGMVLTPAGRTLLGYAESLLHLADEARRAVQDEGACRGSLALGAMETTAAVRLPPILARFHQAWPDVELSLATGPSAELIDRVLDYSIDGAFVGGAVRHAEIEQETLFAEELVLVTDRQVTEPAQMAQRTMLVFRQGCTYRARLEQMLREYGLLPYKIMEFGTVEAILGCVAAGMGVSLFPHFVLARSPYQKVLRMHPLPDHLARVPTMFIRRRDGLRTRAMAAFLEMARRPDESTAVEIPGEPV